MSEKYQVLAGYCVFFNKEKKKDESNTIANPRPCQLHC